MLVLLRIIFGLALAYAVKLAYDNSQAAGAAGIFNSIVYVVVVVGLALANAIVWAPYIGGRMADAMSGEGADMGADQPPKPPKTGFAKFLSLALRFVAVAILVGLGLLMWQYRALFDPLVDLGKAWRMGNAPWSAPTQTLTVQKVIDAENLQARDDKNRLFTIRLAGVNAPSGGSYDPELRRRATAGREFLQRVALSNSVQVEVTLTNAGRVMLGFVHLGETNLNAALIESGYVTFEPEYLGSASIQNRWALLQADRRVQRLLERDGDGAEE